jgi:hypothetical protein
MDPLFLHNTQRIQLSMCLYLLNALIDSTGPGSHLLREYGQRSVRHVPHPCLRIVQEFVQLRTVDGVTCRVEKRLEKRRAD